MARVRIEIDAIDNASQAIRQTDLSLTDLKSGIDLVATALAGMYEIGKKAYDMGRAGAELEYAEIRFGRLAERIDTTSEALMGKLREATQGTLSDAELMAGAADLMGLGLAKNESQVVRLSRVIAGLGMDMNQLVLTMSNQTTMRFDQLGVSIDGFQERVDALKKSGMSANDAFNEAFLQQAEEQLTRVGNKADETIGSFQRFEAALKNISDQAKRDTAPAIASVVDTMADLLEQGAKNNRYREITRGMSDIERGAFLASMAASDWNDAQREAMKATQKTTDAVEDAIPAIDRSAETTYDAKRAAQEAADSYEDYWRSMREAKQASDDLADAQRELELAQANFNERAGADFGQALKDALAAGTITMQEYEQALGAVDDASGTNLLTEKQMADAQAALVKQFADGTISADGFRKGIENFQSTWGPFNEDIEEAGKKVQYLQEMLDRLEGTYNIDININQNGSLPGTVNPGGYGGSTDDWSNHASGGPVRENTPYLVGEMGPELFIPQASGTIIPASQTQTILNRGGNTYNLTIRTDRSPRVVQRGFAIMQTLAGV